MTNQLSTLLVLVSLLIACGSQGEDAAVKSERGGESTDSGIKEAFVYFGTYTRGESEGIYIYRINLETGDLSPVGVQSGIANPSFLAIHPNQRYLYSVAEVGEFAEMDSGGVAAFAIDPETGLLTPLNQQPSMGKGPCHVSIDKSGKNVLVANYSGGSVTVIPIAEDGQLAEPSCTIQHEGSSIDPQRQKKPYAHSINPGPEGKFVFAADLGTDKIFIYRIDPALGMLVPNDEPWATVAPGSGPRHFSFHPNGRFAYVINEMACTITAFSYDAERGALREIQTVPTLPDGEDLEGKSTAEVLVSPSGRFLYGSNRGHDSIVVFAVDEQKGTLTLVEHEPTQGQTPRNFGIDPTGRFLLAANQNSHTVVVFQIDDNTGELTPTGKVLDIPIPVCVRFLPIASQ
jgi:6-phosphogluconolactonase